MGLICGLSLCICAVSQWWLVPKTLRDPAGSLPTPTQQEFGRGPSLEPLPPKHRLVLETAFCYSVVSALVRTPLSPWKRLPSRRQLSGCSLQLTGPALCPLPHALPELAFPGLLFLHLQFSRQSRRHLACRGAGLVTPSPLIQGHLYCHEVLFVWTKIRGCSTISSPVPFPLGN